MVEKDTKKVGCSFQENIAYLERVLPVKESFDIVRRDMEIGERAATFYFIDGFTKDESMLKIMDSLFSAKAEDMPEDGTTFARRHIPYVEVDLVQSFDEVFRNLLSGATCLFIEGYEVCFVIDCRTYPARSVDEPDKDKSARLQRRICGNDRVQYGASPPQDPGCKSGHGDDRSRTDVENGYCDLLYERPGGSGIIEKCEQPD